MDLETIELGGLRSADPLITTDALSTAINSLADTISALEVFVDDAYATFLGNISANASAIESLSSDISSCATSSDIDSALSVKQDKIKDKIYGG